MENVFVCFSLEKKSKLSSIVMAWTLEIAQITQKPNRKSKKCRKMKVSIGFAKNYAM